MSNNIEDFKLNLIDDKEIAFMGACLTLIATRRAVQKRLRDCEEIQDKQVKRLTGDESLKEMRRCMELTMNETYRRVTYATNFAKERAPVVVKVIRGMRLDGTL